MNDRIPRLLVVDDEPAVLMSHTAILQRTGYEVTPASTAEQAIQLLSERSFDLLICDLSLGADSGLDVIAAAVRDHHAMPVVLMTGYSDALLPKELAEANITVVAKPTNVPEFLETIRRLLRPGNGSDHTQAAD